MSKQPFRDRQNARLILEELEERRLFSGGIEGLIDSGLDSSAIYRDATEPANQNSDDSANASDAEYRTRELVFVDTRVDDYAALVESLSQGSDRSHQIEVVVLERERDGIEQISTTLASYDDLDAVHVISHGGDGSIQLGNTVLDADTLEQNQAGVALWANAFAETGDILIYGCNLAASEAGQSLINDLAGLTLADVAASDDLTGHASLGGDWQLEFSTGTIEAQVAISEQGQESWSAILAATADDDFAYPVGDLAGNGGGTGWAGAWSGGSTVKVVASSLAHPTGGLDTSGGATELNAPAFNFPAMVERDLASSMGTVDETIWASFLLQPDETTDPNNSYMGLTFGTGGIANTNQLFVGYSGTDFKMNSWGGGGVNIDVPGVVSGETVFLVVKIDILASGNDTATLYVNPTAGLTNPDVAGSATKADLDLGTFSTISIAGGRDGATNASLLDQVRIGSSFADVAPSLTTNEAPVFSGLDGNPTFVENDAPVVLDSNVTILDAELSAADNFDGATLMLVRNGGANAEDIFSATGTLGALNEGGNLVVGGTTIGTVTTNSAGTLALTFNSNATNALVDSAMQLIAYSNSSSTPPTSVQIDWTFDDGNSGAQGSGGALQATGSTTVNIDNIVSSISVTGDATVVVGAVYTLNLSADATPDTWTINWGDGTIDTIAGALTSATHTYAVGGLTNNITVSATDAGQTFYDSALIVGNAATGADGFLLSVGFDPATGLGDVAGALTMNTPVPSDLDWAADVIVGPSGDIYATGYQSGNVVRFDGATGAFVEEFVTTSQPVSIAFGPDGNLYVASDLGHVKRFDGTTGAYIDDFLTLGYTPEEMTFGADGNLYVGQYNPGRIYRYDGETGAPVDGGAAFIDPETTGTTADDINYSEQFAFGPDGNIYVASMTDGKIQRYDGTTGAFIDTFANPGLNGAGWPRGPTGVAFGPDGHLYVTTVDRVERYDGTSGAYLDDYIPVGSGLDNPWFSTFTPNHQVYVSPDTPAVITGDTSYSGNEGDAVAGDLNATDVDGLTDGTYFSVTTQASNGTAAINATTGAWTFTPADPNWFGSDSFTVTVTDDLGGTTTQVVSITLANVDDPATITGDISYSGNEGDAVAGDLNATDVDGLTDGTYFSVTTPASNGTAAINATTGAWTFTPTGPNWFGSDSFTVTVTDDLGGTTTQVVNITLAPANDAPVLAGANDLTAIDEDPLSNPGTLVSALIAGQVSDVDGGALEGIAVIAVDDTNGTWQYSTDGGGNWTDFGAVGASDARLLAADANTYVRFVPNTNFSGTVTEGITFHAWDQTSGTAGGTASLTSTHTLRDEFSSGDYTGNDGTQNWSNDWQESDDAGGGPSAGLIRVEGTRLLIQTDTPPNNIWREADLSAASSATLTFDVDNQLTGPDTYLLQVSGNGGSTWATLATYDAGNTGVASESFDISAYIASNTRVRIIASAADGDNPIYFDNVQIQYATAGGTGGTTAFSAASASSSITVNPVDDPATIGGDISFSGNEGDVVAGTMTATDVDGLTDGTYFGVTTPATNGTAAIDPATGDWTFTPTDPNWFGSDSFTVTVTDDLGGTTTQVVSITLANVDDPATIGGDVSFSGDEGDAVTGTLTASDVDGLTDGTYFSVTTPAGNGTAAIDQATGAWTFTPTDPNWFGSDSFTVTVTDDLGGTTTQVVSITLANVDDPATIGGDISFSGNEGDTVAGDLNATDVDGLSDGTYFSVTTPASNGSAAIDAATGAWTFTPTDPNWFGSDSFTVTVTDDQGGTTTQVVSITLANVDDPATITGDISFSGNEGDAVAGDLNATDVDGLTDGTYFSVTTPASNGSAAIDAATGAWTFTPTDPNWFGSDSFTVTVTDDLGGTTTQVVNITLANVDDPAIITGDVSFSGNEGDAVAGDLNATDVEGLTDGTYFSVTTPASNGTAAINAATGAWTFTPTDPNWFGSDSFTVTVTDDLGGTTTQVINITLANVDDPATITGDISFSGNEGDAVAGDLNATDVDGLTDGTYFSVTTPAGNGTAAIDPATGAWTFTPTDPNWFGSDSFTVTVTDDQGGTATQVVNITLANVDDPATITGDISFSGNEGDAVTGDLNATDVDGLTDGTYFSITTPASNGTAAIDATTGAWTFTPFVPNWVGSDSFTVTVTDDQGGATTQLINIGLAALNNAPVIGGTDSGSVTEDQADGTGMLTESGALTIADPDVGESSFIAGTVYGSVGNLTIDTAGNWSYSVNNGQAVIQALDTGQSLNETLTVTAFDGTTYDIVITINGITDATPPPPESPPPEPPPEAEAPSIEEPDTEAPITAGAPREPAEIVRMPQETMIPVTQASESDPEPETEPVAAPERPKVPVSPPAQAAISSSLGLDLGQLQLQVSDDAAINDQFERALLEHIERMHAAIDQDGERKQAEDIEVQILLGTSASLTAGIVSWVLRGGSLLASLMSTVPLLNRFDPLPILKSREEREKVAADDDAADDTQMPEHERRVDSMFANREAER